MIQVVDKLIEEGTMKKLVDAGLISSNVVMFRDIYKEYLKQISTDKKKMDIIEAICVKFSIQQSTVYRAINKMKE